jgi:hypothetical protein
LTSVDADSGMRNIRADYAECALDQCTDLDRVDYRVAEEEEDDSVVKANLADVAAKASEDDLSLIMMMSDESARAHDSDCTSMASLVREDNDMRLTVPHTDEEILGALGRHKRRGG